jgi:predicted lipid-binding transport protein (Tim44 family)
MGGAARRQERLRMGDGFNILEILLLAMVAGFIVLRLRSVLGRRTGAEPPPRPTPYGGTPNAERPPGNVVQLPGRAPAQAEPLEGPAAAGLGRIVAINGSFRPSEFLNGAKGAYEMVVTAFAKGDVTTLRSLLGDEVYGSFSGAIDQRNGRGETQETTLVGIKQAEIVEADVTGGRMAEVTVKFVSELVNATRDKTGQLTAGNPNAVEETVDIWTFARNLKSSDPNWQLIATATPA